MANVEEKIFVKLVFATKFMSECLMVCIGFFSAMSRKYINMSVQSDIELFMNILIQR